MKIDVVINILQIKPKKPYFVVGVGTRCMFHVVSAHEAMIDVDDFDWRPGERSETAL